MTELQFPIDFTCCPNCGSERRVAETVTNEEIEKGNLKPEHKTPFIASRALIFDPSSMKLVLGEKIVTALYGFIDICADCGTVYARHIEKGQAVVGIELMPPKGQVPPGFGRG